MFLMRSPRLRASLVRGSFVILALCGLMSGPAQARIFIGLGIPLFFPPVVVGPPAYYPPYYGPPPVVYAPPANNFSYTPAGPQTAYAPSGGYGAAPMGAAPSCRAGAYVCPLVEDTPPGGSCACRGNGGQWMRGQAD